MDKRKKLLIAMGGNKVAFNCVLFNATTTIINCGSEASVDNLPAATFTAEAWVKPYGVGEVTVGRIFYKRNGNPGWSIFTTATNKLNTWINVGASNNQYQIDFDYTDQTWHHVEMSYDNTSEKKIRLFVDGVIKYTSSALVGEPGDDAAADLIIGASADGSGTWNGYIAWARISNVLRHTANFTPPPVYLPPAVDVNTVRLFKLNEGTGTTITDYSANAQNGTLANGTWVRELVNP